MDRAADCVGVHLLVPLTHSCQNSGRRELKWHGRQHLCVPSHSTGYFQRDLGGVPKPRYDIQ